MKLLSFLLFLNLGANSALATVKLALNWKPEPQFGGFYQAQIDKAFAAQGLPDVEILEGGSGTPTVQMLANDRVDYAIVSAEEILTNNSRNPDHAVVALFAVFQTNPQVLLCRPEVKGKNLSEIFNQNITISWQAGLTYALYLKNKFHPTTPQFVPYLGGLSSYLQRDQFCQQGFATSEPLLAENAGKPGHVFLVSQEGFNPYTTVVATTLKNWRSNPTEVGHFVAAVRQGWTAYLQSPQNANAKMSGLNKSMERPLMDKSSNVQKKLIEAETGELGTMNSTRWQDLIHQLEELKVIKPGLKAADQFLEQVAKTVTK